VDPARIRALADQYFSRLTKRPQPDAVLTIEPVQDGVKHVEVATPAQPMEFVAYHRPDQYDKDDPVFDVLSDLLSGGRTSLLYTDMVRDKKMSLAAGAQSEFPGGKYPSLFFFYLIPGLGHTAAENEKELDAVIANLKKDKVDAAALARVKTRTRAALIRQLDDNAGLAQLLATYYANYGDWKKLFTSIDDIDKVTVDDVQRVARQYLTTENRTVAVTFQPPEPSSGQQAPVGGAQ